MNTPTQTGPDTRIALVTATVFGLAFVILAWWMIPWHWLPGGQVDAVPAREVFSAAQIERGEHVSGMLRQLGWAGLAVSLLVGGMLGFTRTGARLVARIPGAWPVKAFVAVGLVTVLGSLATIPLGWRAQSIERDEGLSQQGWASWLGDRGLNVLVAWVFTGVGVLAMMWIARRLPRTWPAWGAVVAAALAVLGSFVYPVVVEPLFNSFTPMPESALRTEILRLADREHVKVSEVLVADASRRTTTLNAYVSGFGSTRRVVVYDNLVEALPPDQVAVVVAHELGHARHDDVLVGTLLGAAGGGFGVALLGLIVARRRLRDRVGADGLGDPRIVPAVLMLVTVGTLLASPIQNTISRAVEARADRAALTATGESEAFIEMQRQLALRSLADPTPPRWSQFWFGSHPTVLQRIGLAEALARRPR